MLRQHARSFVKPGLAFFASLLFATSALAGGFQIAAENPRNHPELSGAGLVVRTFGCREPANATLTGTAEGIVNGRRQSVPLHFTLTSTGVYAVKRLWPAEGAWVLAINGSYWGHSSSILVELDANGELQTVTHQSGAETVRAQVVPRQLTAQEIEGALQALANGQSVAPLPASDGTSEMGMRTMGLGAGVGGLSLIGLALFAWRARRHRTGDNADA